MAPASSATRLLLDLLRPERRRLAALVGVLLGAMLLPVAGPAIVGRVVDDALAGEPIADLTTLAALYLGVALLAEALQLLLAWSSVQVAWTVGNRLRERLADHVLALDLAWHTRHNPGELISRIDGDAEALTLFGANIVVRVVGNLVLVVGVVVATLVIDWRIGLVVLATSIASVSTMVALRGRAVAANELEREEHARLYGDLEERLAGLEDLRANGGGRHVMHRLEAASSRLWHATRRAWSRADGAYALSAGTFALGTVVTLAGAALLHRRGDLTIGGVLALFRYVQMVRQPLERAAEQLPELQRALAGTSRAAALLAERPTLTFLSPEQATPLPPGALALDFDAAELAYDGEPPALRGVDLHLAAGTTLGVVGRTGSGKTTLGRLAVRFWDPTAGAVRLGGLDLREVAAGDLRRRVAVVTQDVELLRASVRDNLTLLGSVAVDDAELRSLLLDVGLGSWFARLDDGLDTVLDAAVGMSAGEAQLLALARAFLADPGLVVLDEASSRLDPVTEAALARATDRLLAGRTAIVIAHRLATLDRVDEVAVVEAGQIVEHGPREVLAADPTSRYSALLATAATAGLLAGGDGSAVPA